MRQQIQFPCCINPISQLTSAALIPTISINGFNFLQFRCRTHPIPVPSLWKRFNFQGKTTSTLSTDSRCSPTTIINRIQISTTPPTLQTDSSPYQRVTRIELIRALKTDNIRALKTSYFSYRLLLAQLGSVAIIISRNASTQHDSVIAILTPFRLSTAESRMLVDYLFPGCVTDVGKAGVITSILR
jgi:hypothetical protein